MATKEKVPQGAFPTALFRATLSGEAYRPRLMITSWISMYVPAASMNC